ncbi:MAG: type II secretion system protein [Epsilonproteobacteria bacterium]|nr:type II secretion system protein [Campylobacterota bacterium]
MNFNKHTKPAFTMLELVFVIVVLGILAALALPRLDRDIRQEAADNILSAIRYTQRLALNDDKHEFNNPFCHRKLWRIRFSNTLYTYTVYSDIDAGGNADTSEIARDPANGKRMDGTDANIDSNDSPNVFLADKYGIDSIVLTGCANPANTVLSTVHIAFDNLGRPHRGIDIDANDLKTYVNTDCILTFQSPIFDSDIVIQIRRETGYAQIVGQDAS